MSTNAKLSLSKKMLPSTLKTVAEAAAEALQASERRVWTIKELKSEIKKATKPGSALSPLVLSVLQEKLDTLSTGNIKTPARQHALLTAHIEEAVSALSPMCDQLVKKLKAFTTAPVSKEVLQGLITIAEQFNRNEKDIRGVQQDLRASSRSDRHNRPVLEAAIDLDIATRQHASLFGVLQLVTRLSAPTARRTPLPCNPDYPMSTRRIRLSKACAISARSELAEAEQYRGEPEMINLLLNHALDHYQLAAALLAGNPTTIEKASGLDTTAREALPDQIWDFMEAIYSGDYKKSKARSPR